MSEDWEQEVDEFEAAEEKKKKEEEEAKKKKLAEEKKKAEEEKKKKEEEEKKKKEEEKKKKEEEKKKKNEKKEDKKDNKNIVLKNEKDYIELAKRNAKKIKDAKPLPIFTLAYLQNMIELLGPSLETNQINEILKLSNNIFNKKLNEGEKKKYRQNQTIK